MVETECANELEPGRILRGASAAIPVAIRAKIFVEIAAVQVDDDVGWRDDLLRDGRERALRLRSVRIARLARVHPLAIDRIHVGRHRLEGRDVEQRRNDDGSGELRGVDARDQLLKRDD